MNAVKNSRDAGLIGNYLTKFPQGTFADTARVMLDQFKTERERSEAVALREAELAKTEEAKRRAEAQQLEAKQKSEAAHQSEELKKAQDELSKAREALASAQREKAAAEKAAAAARQMQDEARKQTEVAAKGETKVVELSTPEVHAAHLTTELVRSIQTELKRLRCYKGEVDGQWGKQAQTAYGYYARRAKVIDGSARTQPAHVG